MDEKRARFASEKVVRWLLKKNPEEKMDQGTAVASVLENILECHSRITEGNSEGGKKGVETRRKNARVKPDSILKALDSGQTPTEVADRFGIDPSWDRKIRKRNQRDGS